MLGVWAGVGSLSPQNCFAAGLLCLSKTCTIPAVPLSLECRFVAEAQSSWVCGRPWPGSSVWRCQAAGGGGDRTAQSSWPCSALLCVSVGAALLCVCLWGAALLSPALCVSVGAAFRVSCPELQLPSTHTFCTAVLLMSLWLSASPGWLPAKTSCVSFCLECVSQIGWTVTSSVNFCTWQPLEILMT